MRAASVPLGVEVVLTNWRDDYYKKLADYVGRSPSRRVEMGIPEYWIADYAGCLGTRFYRQPQTACFCMRTCRW